MATEKNFQATDPAAPSGARNGIWQVDPTPGGTDLATGLPYYNASVYQTDMVGDSGSGGDDGLVPAPGAGDAAAGKFLKADGTWKIPVSGGVNEQTGSYAALAGDAGKLIVFNSSSAATLTLPASPPTSTWGIFVENINTGLLTVSPNSLDLDGAAGSVTLTQNQGLYISTDGTNYFSERGRTIPGGSSPQVQYNNSGVFAGITGATSDGTNLLVTTQTALDDSTKAASTAYVDTAVAVVKADIGISTIGITIDGGGSPPTTGLKGMIQIPFGCTITGWSLIADQSGSASIDIWAIAGSAPPTAPTIPTSTNKISASAPAALSSAQSAAGGTSAISTWTKAIAQWTTVGFNLSSVTTCTRLTLALQVTRT